MLTVDVRKGVPRKEDEKPLGAPVENVSSVSFRPADAFTVVAPGANLCVYVCKPFLTMSVRSPLAIVMWS